MKREEILNSALAEKPNQHPEANVHDDACSQLPDLPVVLHFS